MKKWFGIALGCLISTVTLADEAKLHGWMTSIPFPLCDHNAAKAFPTGTLATIHEPSQADKMGLGSKVIPANFLLGKKDASIDFGGGVSLHHLNDTFLKCEVGSQNVKHHPNERHYYEFHQQNFKPGEPVPLAILSGFVHHTKPARIRGEVSFQFEFLDFAFPIVFPNAGPFANLLPLRANEIAENGLILHVAYATEEGKWKGIAMETNGVFGTEFPAIMSKYMQRGMHHWVVEAEVPAKSAVKVFFSANWGNLTPTKEGANPAKNTLRLYDARLFGAQCYPDFSASDKCVE